MVLHSIDRGHSGVDGVILLSPMRVQGHDSDDVKKLYNNSWNGIGHADIEVATTSEEERKYVLIDVKGIFDRKEAEALDFLYWRL